jgi:hypothetical protein
MNSRHWHHLKKAFGHRGKATESNGEQAEAVLLRLVLMLLIDQNLLLFELSAPSHGEQQNSRRNFACDSSLVGVGVPQLRASASGWLACSAKAALHVARQFGPMTWALPARLA